MLGWRVNLGGAKMARFPLIGRRRAHKVGKNSDEGNCIWAKLFNNLSNQFKKLKIGPEY